MKATAGDCRAIVRIGVIFFLTVVPVFAAAAEAVPPVRIGIDGRRDGLMSKIDSTGRPEGFMVELLAAMQRTGGIEFELVPDSWTELIAKFNAGRIDVLGSIVVSAERRETMDFSIIHATLHGVGYYRSDRPAVRRTADLSGKKIGVLGGTVEHTNSLKYAGWGGIVVPKTSIDALFQAVADGQVDVALSMRRQHPKATEDHRLRSEFIEGILHEFRFAVHRGDRATLARLNDALAAVQKSGEFNRLYAKWIGPIEPNPLRLADLKPLFFPAVLVLVAVVVIIVWQRRMLAQRAAQAVVLRETEERYRGLVETAFDGSVIYQDGMIRTVNAACAAMFGYEERELIGRPITDLAPVEHRTNTEALIAAGADGPRETVGLRKDGGLIQIESAGRSCAFEGRSARIVAVRNITDRKAAEAAVRRLNNELEARVDERTAELARRVAQVERLYAEQEGLLRRVSASQQSADRSAARLQELNANLLAANHELEAFSYSVSHDLRAPLRNITGFVELLAKRTDGQVDAESKRFLATLTTEATRMGMLIDDLLTFSRIGRAEMNVQRVDLQELVGEVREELRTEIGDRVIEWRIEPLPLASGDRALLRQVLANLLGNAVKFTRTRPAAVIELGVSGVSGPDSTQSFFVRDNGVGFNPKYLDRLFGVFQRLHNQRDFEGTGIGLANVKRIINRHGGRVWAEGSVDKGAAFYFTLPTTPA